MNKEIRNEFKGIEKEKEKHLSQKIIHIRFFIRLIYTMQIHQTRARISR